MSGKKFSAKKLSGTTHTTKAKLTIEDEEGKPFTDDFSIEYRGMSPAVARAVEEAAVEGDTEGRVEMAKYLAATVVSMPEFVGDDEKPVETNFEFFDGMEVANLKAVFEAVQEGYNPPTEPSAS